MNDRDPDFHLVSLRSEDPEFGDNIEQIHIQNYIPTRQSNFSPTIDDETNHQTDWKT
jgi:hypothetical protein